MKKKKLELLRSKLAMFAMATSLSVTSLSGCSSNNILSTEKIEKSITKEQDFANNAGLYKNQDGTWKIYFENEGNFYDLKSYEYLDKAVYHASIYTNDAKLFGFNVGYLPFIRCNPNVTYTLNVVNNLDEADIEKLKNDFFQKNSFWTEDIRLFYIEDIDGTKQKTIIGYPVSKTEIFNMETWQFENYEGNAIIEENCEFKNNYVYLSDVLNYLNEKKNNIEEIPPIEIESGLKEKENIETEKKLEVIPETEAIDDEEKYEIKPYSSDSNSIKININYNFTSKDLTEVLDVLNQKDKIKTLSIDAHHKYLAISEEIFKEISAKDNIEKLELCGFENLNLSNIVRMSNLKCLSLMSCTMEDNTQLNQFTQLERLTLVDIISDLNAISNLTQLKDLLVINFDAEKLKDIEILSQFKNLETLQLPNHNISNISCLSELNQLYTLDLRGNKINDIKSLESLENLGYVSLKENPITDVSVLNDMKSAPMIYFGEEVNIENLKPCISELTEKGFDIHYGSDNELITKEYFERKEEFQLKLNK